MVAAADLIIRGPKLPDVRDQVPAGRIRPEAAA